jgi:fibronectin-binding autotransporter adhesin
LTLAGVQAASPNTIFNMNTGASSSSTTIKFLDDTNNVNGSTTTFAGAFRNNSNNTPGAGTTFIVGNNNTTNGGTSSGTTTGSTIGIGTLDWGSEATGTVNYGPINIQGTNGYRMYISNVVLYKATNVTSGTVGNTSFVPSTANVTIGDVTMGTGNTGQGYQTFVMDGTSLDNQVQGTISNASDFATSNRELRVTKSNTSNWTLFGNNTYTGATTVSGGVLNVYELANGGSNSNIGASSSAAGNLILNGGTLRYVGGGGSTDRLFSLQTSSTIDASGGGAVNFNNSGSMGFNGGTAAKTLTLTGNNTGNNTIAAVIGDNTGATAITKTGIGTWVLSATNTNTGATSLSGGGALILDYGTNDTNKIAGVLSLGGGSLIFEGAGSHIEEVTSTSLNAGGAFLFGGYGAKLRMNAITRAAGGTISFDSATLADTDTNNVNSILGGWATLGNDWAVSTNSGAADTAVTAFTSYTGALPSGTVGAATANYTLTGNQTQSTSVAANTVRITNLGADSQTLALAANNLTITSASATSLGGIMYIGNDGVYSISGTTGRIQTSAANQELIFAVQTGTLSVDAFVGASGSSGIVTKSGNGTLAIGSANNYTGITRVNQGALRLRHATAAGTTAGGITVQNGAALEIANGISVGAEALTITGTGVSNGGALRNIASNASSYAGAITLGAGGARIHSDASGALTLTGGVVTSLFNDVTFGGAGNTTVSTAAISGAGGLIKDGAGITTLTATNTYTGATRVSNGILSIGTVASPTGSINSSALTINGGNFRNNSSTNYTGALNFTNGTISGTNWGGSLSDLTIGLDQIVSPGNSPGTAVTGNQTWAAGGTYVWEINSTLGSSGSDPGWDLINGSGTLNITSTSEFDFSIDITSLTTGNAAGEVFDFDQSLNYNWLIADFASVTGFSEDKFWVNTSSFSNAYTGIFAVALGDSGTIGGDNTQIWLTYTAIPEPKAALLGGLGLLLLLRRRREK